MANYTQITIAEMRDVLRAQNGWTETDPSTLHTFGIKEYVFEWPITKVGQPVKVYSSIALSTGVTRQVGADAIRVCVPGWSSSVRVHRVEGWRANLIARVTEMIADVTARWEKKQANAVALENAVALDPVPSVATPSVPVYQSVLDLFANATTSKLKKPRVKFNVDGQVVQLHLAGMASKYAGQIIVSDGGPWGASLFFGTINKQGEWLHSKKVTPQVAEIVKGFASDPAGFASKYGKKSGQCCFCGLTLETPESTAVGYGPVCAKKFALPWGKVEVQA